MKHRSNLAARLLIAATLTLSFTNVAAAEVLLIGQLGPAGPAGWLASQQIAHWPTESPLKIVDHDPEQTAPQSTLILELTEDFDFRGEMPMANGATIHVRAQADSVDKTEQLARKMADAVNATIEIPGEQFIVETTVDAAESVPRITVITSTKDELNRQRLSKRTRQHRVAVQAALAAEKVIRSDLGPQRIAADHRPGVLRVAFFDDKGARNRTIGSNPVWIRESMRGERDLDVYLVSAADIRAGSLDGQFDVLVIGGGSSKTESSALGEKGRKAVQTFVEQGGGYVGICAGAFLAARNSFGLSIIPVKTKPTKAGGEIDMQVTGFARQLSTLPEDNLTAAFHGGPVLIPAEDASKFNLKIWANYAGELVRDSEGSSDQSDAQNGETPSSQPTRSKVLLKNTPAIVGSEFGRGRVVIFGPHCERVVSNQPLFWSAIRWAGHSNSQSAVKLGQAETR